MATARYTPRRCLQCPTDFTPRASTERLCPACAPVYRREANRLYEQAKRRGQKISTKIAPSLGQLKSDAELERELVAWWDARYGGDYKYETSGRQQRSTICDL